ncbi:hypothetical protein V6259_18035 [Marinomonas sp. TI.3.20]|uniref:hypothetical protein n=1 Tax=Marinomonas sp. TI.3.20 TaxID=3121296 RepID=UPI00311EE37C
MYLLILNLVVTGQFPKQLTMEMYIDKKTCEEHRIIEQKKMDKDRLSPEYADVKTAVLKCKKA